MAAWFPEADRREVSTQWTSFSTEENSRAFSAFLDRLSDTVSARNTSGSVNRSLHGWKNSVPLRSFDSSLSLLLLMPLRAVRTVSRSHGTISGKPSWSIRHQKAFSIMIPALCSPWAGECSASKFWRTLPGIKSELSILWMR
ncbi:putative Invasion plasmid antigen [Shigella flexneri SFJ17B]|nr:putative Invasion plasmid antigen [Shigella flexneri SFJ17B]